MFAFHEFCKKLHGNFFSYFSGNHLFFNKTTFYEFCHNRVKNPSQVQKILYHVKIILLKNE